LLAHALNAPKISFTGLNSRHKSARHNVEKSGRSTKLSPDWTALWDMAARRSGLPLRRFINATTTNQVTAYASGIQVAEAAEVLPRARTEEHQTFKLKVGFDMAADISAVCAIQNGLSASEAIACDANQAWSVDQAQRFVTGITGVPLQWLEEPLPVFAQTTQWQSLAQSCPIPLAGGENLSGNAEFDDAINLGHLSVIQPDVTKWGGITGCLGVAKTALGAGRRYFPHFLGAGIGLAASAELLAAVGGDGLLEIDVNDNPLRSLFLLAQNPFRRENGPATTALDSGLRRIPMRLINTKRSMQKCAEPASHCQINYHRSATRRRVSPRPFCALG